MDLLQMQQTMHLFLRGQLSVQTAAKNFHVPENRLAAYAGFVQNHIVETLNKVFSSLRNQLSTDFWQQLTTNFYQKFPATHYELNTCVESFVEYLGDHPDMTLAQFEIALVEWQEWLAYSDPVDVIAGQGVNRTLKILQLEFPEKHIVFVWRDLQHRVHQMSATHNLLFAFKVMHDNIPLEKAAQDANISIETAQQFIHDAYHLELLV